MHADSERGIGLILALIVLALLSLLVAAMLTAVSVEVWIGDNFTRETQLVYLAEAGIEEGREQLQEASLVPSPVPFIKDETLLDTTRQGSRALFRDSAAIRSAHAPKRRLNRDRARGRSRCGSRGQVFLRLARCRHTE